MTNNNPDPTELPQSPLNQCQLGVITNPTRKLITSETETAVALKMLLWQTLHRQQQLQNSHSTFMFNILLVDVAGNTLTMTSIQLQPDALRDDDETIARVNTTTNINRLRLRVQVQLFQPARNIGRRRR